MSALLAFYLLSYIIIILFFSNIWFTILIYILTLTVWGILYGCILQYRILTLSGITGNRSRKKNPSKKIRK